MEYENKDVKTRELQIDLWRKNCNTFINIAEKTQQTLLQSGFGYMR
jgi:hypothetical protein